jgi:hypothetical protein
MGGDIMMPKLANMFKLIESRYAPVIDRNEEIFEVSDRLEDMGRGVTREDNVLFFSGPPLVGKTAFLKEVRRRCSSQSIPTALINFQNRSGGSLELLKRRIATDLIDQLTSSSDFIGYGVTDQTPIKSVPGRVTDYIRGMYNAWGNHKPPVLFFDAIEACNPEIFEWMQKEILTPILTDNSTRKLIVLAGRTAEPRISKHHIINVVNQHLKPFPLKPFDEETTISQLQAIGADRSLIDSGKLMKFTNGFPGLNDKAIRWINERREYSEDDLLSHMADSIMFECSPDKIDPEADSVKSELLAAALLFSFDENLLAGLASKPTNGTRELKRLTDTQLVEPHPNYGYTIISSLKEILAQHFERSQPNICREIYQLAKEEADLRIKGHDFSSIVDWLYYSAKLKGDKKTAQQKLTETIAELKKMSYPTEFSLNYIEKNAGIVFPGISE